MDRSVAGPKNEIAEGIREGHREYSQQPSLDLLKRMSRPRPGVAWTV